MTNRPDDSPSSHRARALSVMSVLAVLNIAAWLLTWRASSAYAFLLASGWLAYSFGLRHAVDADHISAIDNVTRKLTRGGTRPVGVGLFFSLGHSTVVLLLCAGLAASAPFVQAHLARWRDYGAVIGTAVSGVFLYAIGIVNLLILIELYRTYRASTSEAGAKGGAAQTGPTGLLGRILRPVVRMVSRSWQMYFVGFLFGLGFDTATEVGILAMSARSASHGLSFGAVMLLPLLFTVGMCFVDTLDGILMAGAYGWAALSPLRQFRYNFGITLVSILVAFFVGTYELAQLAADRLTLPSVLRLLLDRLDMGLLGIGIVIGFALLWAAVAVTGRRRSATVALL